MSLHEPRFARHIYRGESLREVFSFYTFIGGKEKSHHDNSFFFFFLASLFRENSARKREEKTRRETRHTLIRQGSLPLLFHLPEFTSPLILDFFVQPLTFSRAGDSIDLVGRITKSEIVSCNTGSITTCLTKGRSDSKRCILGGWF